MLVCSSDECCLESPCLFKAISKMTQGQLFCLVILVLAIIYNGSIEMTNFLIENKLFWGNIFSIDFSVDCFDHIGR